MRTQKALINTFSGLLQEAVSLICSMILPRLILRTFGSDYNGITHSISQFLSCIALLRSGIGGVTRAALYKPLADGDNLAYSRVLRATEIFMRKIALIFLAFLVCFASVYPIFVRNEFDWLFSSSLVLILGVSTFMQYYFGFTYQMILNADQRQCVTSFVQIFTTVLNTIVACILINNGFGIHAVKLGSAAIFALNPLFINYYARRRYKIVRGVEPDNMALGQRWDAFAHQAANFVHSNTDIIVLTMLADIRTVSVYATYYLVINGMQGVVRNSIPGVASAFGDMIAKGQKELLEKNFRIFELVVYTISTILYTITGVMIVKFVMLYATGVTDADYFQPLFGVLVTVGAFFSGARNPYQHVVEAAGHYKQTRNGAFFEAGLNIVISVIAVFRFGLVGVALGTVAATGFRTFQYALYLSKNIIPRKNTNFYLHLAVSAGVAAAVVLLHSLCPPIPMHNYMYWVADACIVGVITTVLTLATDVIFFRQDCVAFLKKMKNAIIKKKK